MSNFKEYIQIQDRVRLALQDSEDIQIQDRQRPDHCDERGNSRFNGPPIHIYQNVDITLREKPNGRVVERRKKHNIFVDYGREWISELVALNVGDAAFRSDRVKYMAFGIGGTRQRVDSATLRSTGAGGYGYTGFPNDWTAPSGTGGAGSGDPAQTDIDPAVTGLEYPVEVTLSNYYDSISQPATFPTPGIVRFTAVLGYAEISFSSYSSVPLSEVGLFTQSALLNGLSDAPLPAPPTRFMIAYNTFDTLHKTSAYVLQVDWELRFS